MDDYKVEVELLAISEEVTDETLTVFIHGEGGRKTRVGREKWGSIHVK